MVTEYIDRCPRPGCNAAMVLVVTDTAVVLRCGHFGHVLELHRVQDPNRSWASWLMWGDTDDQC